MIALDDIRDRLAKKLRAAGMTPPWALRFLASRGWDPAPHLPTLVNGQGRGDLTEVKVPPLSYLAPDRPTPERMKVCDRLIASYNRAIGENQPESAASTDGIWDVLARANHAELSAALRQRDRDRVFAQLSGMFIGPVTNGLALGAETAAFVRKHEEIVGLDWHDKTISLAAALGLIPEQCPEQGEYGTALDLDSVRLMVAIGQHLDLNIAPPQVGAMFGVAVAGAVYPVNYLLHILTAHKLRSILLATDEPLDCIEIGGGVGFLAFAALNCGFRRFCIIDLPLVNVIQGYYLLNSALADRVTLFGEGPLGTTDGISLLPAAAIKTVAPQSFSIAINQDSMPEMAHAVAEGYLKDIPVVARRYFLSINQEGQCLQPSGFRQGWVHDLCSKVPELRLMSRAPFWIRKGYVEELYAISNGRQ